MSENTTAKATKPIGKPTPEDIRKHQNHLNPTEMVPPLSAKKAHAPVATDAAMAPWDPSDAIVVNVLDMGDMTNDVHDAAPRMAPREEAEKLDRNLRATFTYRQPTPPSDENVNPAVQKAYEAQLRAYEKKIAAIPSHVPVQRAHGRTGREPGFYVVTGREVVRRRVLITDRDGRHQDLPGTTWYGPYDDIDDADEQLDWLLAGDPKAMEAPTL